MKIIQKELHINSRTRNQMIDITSQIEAIVSQSGVKNGDAVIYCPHTQTLMFRTIYFLCSKS